MKNKTEERILEAYKKFDKYTKVNLDVLYAFLYSKGWKSLGQKDRFELFQAPKEFHFNSDGIYKMPSNELQDIFDYGYYMKNILEYLCELYELKEENLLNILTKTPEELKKEAESTTLVLQFLKESA